MNLQPNALPLTIAERQDAHERNQTELMRAHNALAEAVATLAEQVHAATTLLSRLLDERDAEPHFPTRESFKRHKGH